MTSSEELKSILKEAGIKTILDRWKTPSGGEYATFNIKGKVYCLSVNLSAPVKYVFSIDEEKYLKMHYTGNVKINLIKRIQEQQE